MHNTYELIIGADVFQLTQFFDTDKSISGIDIKTESGEHIGEILDMSIPELNEEDENIPDFEKKVTDWLESNYYKS